MLATCHVGIGPAKRPSFLPTSGRRSPSIKVFSIEQPQARQPP